MTEWGDLIVVLFGKYLQIYPKPQPDTSGGEILSLCNLALPLPEAICEVHFHSYGDRLYDAGEGQIDSLYIFVRQNRCIINILELRPKNDSATSRTFAIFRRGKIQVDATKTSPEDLMLPCRLAVGSTGSAIAWLGCTIADRLEGEMPAMFMNSIDVKTDETTGTEVPFEICNNVILPRNGVPMLHHFSCFDFDDGRGLLALGTSIGEVAIIRFCGSSFYKDGCLNDELPNMVEYMKGNTDTISVSMAVTMSRFVPLTLC